MTSFQSYAIARAVLNKVLPQIFSNKREAASAFKHDASLNWQGLISEENINLKGRLEIYEFFKTLPHVKQISILSYDTHTVLDAPNLSHIQVFGNIEAFNMERFFVASFHILNSSPSQKDLQDFLSSKAIIVSMNFRIRSSR